MLKRSSGGRNEDIAMAATCRPEASRAREADFVEQCSLPALQARLPLRWAETPDLPPSPKRSYRSWYAYPTADAPAWQALLELTAWQELDDFDLVLLLVDFSGLRPVLARRLNWTSARGYRPFDPVSLFLLQAWQIVNGWTRTDTLANLRKQRYADYAARFGFRPGIYPTEGGMRHFLTSLGRYSEVPGQTVRVQTDEGQAVDVAIQSLNQLLAGAVDLVRQAGLLSPQAWQEALVCPDGMLHQAASHLRCASVQDSCYQATTAQAPRPCPAKDKKRTGCDCNTAACAQSCQHAPARDVQARFVWYSSSNQRPDNPNRPAEAAQSASKPGKGCYGYRSQSLLLSDPIRRFHLRLLSDLMTATAREEVPATAMLRQLKRFYPDLHLDAFAADAAYGYDVVLHTLYDMHVKRLVDLRAQATDADKANWPVRGYDDKGRPMCAYGYAFTSNGFDAERRRHKWFCGQACLHDAQPAVQLDGVHYPPQACPYRRADLPHGRILNVGECFPDGSRRLVRDVPVGSALWKQLYHRARNASESRNATCEHLDLKRLPVYGQLRAKALIFLADTWSNLLTLARLVREATFAVLPT